MVIMAARPLRNHFYSFFIILHVCLFLLFCIGTIIHRPQQAGWIVAGLGLYFLDRIWRTARIYWHHGLQTLPKNPLGMSGAWVEYLSDDTIKVCVKTRMSRWLPLRADWKCSYVMLIAWIPGQHGFLHAPKSERYNNLVISQY